MATLTTGDFAEVQSRQMSRYVVTVTSRSVLEDEAAKYDGDVKSTQGGDQSVVAVTKFEDEEKGKKFSISLNGTTFRDEWAAKYHADSRVQGSTS